MAEAIVTAISAQKINLQSKLLFAPLWLTPLALLIVTLDCCLFDRTINNVLPKSPEDIFIFSLIFVLPHAIASSFSFCDMEYIKYYKKRLLIAISTTFILIGVIHNIVGFSVFVAFFSIWTLYHTVAQLFGTCFILARNKNKQSSIWKWLGFVVALAIYADVTSNIGNEERIHELLLYGSLLFCFAFTVATFKYAATVKENKGIRMIWHIYALIICSWIFYALDYSFFVILVPRIVHDVSAFIFYIAHDHNRNHLFTNNFLYKPFTALGLPIYVIVPALAIFIGYIVKENINLPWAVNAYFAILYFHYITDGFAWKNGTTHRREIMLK